MAAMNMRGCHNGSSAVIQRVCGRDFLRQFLATAMTVIVTFDMIFFCCCFDGGPHARHSFNANKERVEDGAIHPQQHNNTVEHLLHFDHEAILGSKEAAEEFDRLPSDEAKRRLRGLASSKMDANKDGHVDREELVRWILHSFKMLNKEDSEERHEESDTNDDGFVTWHEYVDENYGIDSTSNSVDGELDVPKEDKRMLQEDKELFAASDLDQDGRLTRAEFSSFAHPEEFEHTGKVLVRRTMEEKDVDQDGFLTLEEYLDDDANGKDKEWHFVEKERFDNYDIDADGQLNEDEVFLWLTPDDRYSAEQEADHLIDTADDDHDGWLTIQEITDHHDAFVGSEATDFGQQLENPDDTRFKEEL